MSLARDGLDGNAGTGTRLSFATTADDEVDVEIDVGSAEPVFTGASDAAFTTAAASAA